MSITLTKLADLPELDDGAAMYGSGDAVTGLPCIIIAIAIFVIR